MIERIQEIIRAKGVTASQFADQIGVPRSSLSHLVSGRNKPSLEFLRKIFTRYPEIRQEWLLNGEGSMLKEENGVERSLPLLEGTLFDQLLTQMPAKETIERSEASRPVRKKPETAADGKKIERIVFFYTDKSFREFIPE